MKTLKTLKRELLAKPEVQVAYASQDITFAIIHELIAERMGTTQSVIARLEGGKRTPSISTVQRYADAAGCKAVLRLEPLSH